MTTLKSHLNILWVQVWVLAFVGGVGGGLAFFLAGVCIAVSSISETQSSAEV